MSNGRVYRLTAYRQGADQFFGAFREELVITEQRIQFKIEKSTGSDPNTAEITITNLGDSARAFFQERPLHVRFEAGYESDGGPRLLFTGDVRKGSASRLSGTAWETKLLLADGSRAFANARINRSYKRGTPVRTVMQDLARSIGLPLPDNVVADPVLRGALSTGEVASGWASDELTRLLAPYGYSWSIQNGQLQILRDEETRAEDFILSPSTGIKGSPELGQPDKTGKKTKTPVLTIKHQLYPEVVPGCKITLSDTRAANGRYKVQKVKSEGDTAGDAWDTEIEAKPI